MPDPPDIAVKLIGGPAPTATSEIVVVQGTRPVNTVCVKTRPVAAEVYVARKDPPEPVSRTSVGKRLVTRQSVAHAMTGLSVSESGPGVCPVASDTVPSEPGPPTTNVARADSPGRVPAESTVRFIVTALGSTGTVTG